jgi:hypothetical protein
LRKLWPRVVIQKEDLTYWRGEFDAHIVSYGVAIVNYSKLERLTDMMRDGVSGKLTKVIMVDGSHWSEQWVFWLSIVG